MPSLKLVLDTRRIKSGGKYPIKLRITYKRSTRDLNLGISIGKKYWDAQNQRVKSNYINYKPLNLKLRKALLEAEEAILFLDSRNAIKSAQNIITHLRNDTQSLDFLSFAHKTLKDLQGSGKEGTARAYGDAVKKMESSFGKSKLHWEEVDYSLLCKWESRMYQDGLTKNAIASYMRAIRAIYNRGIKEGLVSQATYPFKSYRIKTEATRNSSFTLEELRLLANQDLSASSGREKHRDIFMLSFYLIGMNYTDLAYLTKEK